MTISIKKCVKCSCTIMNDYKYCPHCGKKQILLTDTKKQKKEREEANGK